ncbi:putative enzyme related to lactoylglutathione lyase [Streptacidiphilus sp. MAP12-33]|uniref:VOC family protein n=1 Tax=Streptacidiphilus sp. MAP12-33 TaxID=3156266 RepID=UPI003511F82E
MPEVTASHYPPGTPCWIDLMAPDQQAALDFYRDLLGWQGEVGSPEFGGYAVCTLNGKPVAGIMKAQPMQEGDPMPPTVWTTYLASTDADATQKAIAAAGGTVMFPVMDVGTIGRMLVAADPTGAVFGVWQPVDFWGAQVVNEPGALTWNELHTPDLAAAGAFYQKAVGLSSVPMEGMDDYHSMNVGDRSVGGMTTMGESAPPGAPPHWLTYFSVDDTDSTVDALIRAGGNVLVPPFDFVAGRMSVVTDPQGAVFAVIKAAPM